MSQKELKQLSDVELSNRLDEALRKSYEQFLTQLGESKSNNSEGEDVFKRELEYI